MSQVESLLLLVLWTGGTFAVWWLLDNWASHKNDEDDRDEW